MAFVQMVSREASDMLSRKFSDLAEDPDYDPIEPYVTAFGVRSGGSRFRFSSHPRVLLRDDANAYPSSSDHLHYLYDESFVASVTPLRAEMLDYSRDPAGGLPPPTSRGLRHFGSSDFKRFRLKCSTAPANLKHKILHWCGASKGLICAKYIGLPV